MPAAGPSAAPPATGEAPNTPGASSRAMQLLRTAREQGLLRLRVHSIHAMHDESVRAVARAVALPVRDLAPDDLRQRIAGICLQAVDYYEDRAESDYSRMSAVALGPFLALTDRETEALAVAMRTARISIGVDRISVAQPVAVAFGGMQSLADLAATVASAAGVRTSQIHSAAINAAAILAPALSRAGSRVELITGFSMGGATAQIFEAALAREMEAAQRPAMVLFDPQLLTRRELAAAVGDRHEGVRGIAFTLNYDRRPKPSLSDRMMRLGYSASHLVQIELPLAPRFVRQHPFAGAETEVPVEIEEPHAGPYGYHDHRFSWFGPHIRRFVADPPAAPPNTPAEGESG